MPYGFVQINSLLTFAKRNIWSSGWGAKEYKLYNILYNENENGEPFDQNMLLFTPLECMNDNHETNDIRDYKLGLTFNYQHTNHLTNKLARSMSCI